MAYGKGGFGSGLELTTEVVNGTCPTCHQHSIFISVVPSFFRCTSCGTDLEQKINGIISYIPSGIKGSKIHLSRVSEKS
jgi:predicted RNA-binding Zn-ribbon protein involved in translation (DUF1610 family)